MRLCRLTVNRNWTKDVLSLPWDDEATEQFSDRDPYKEMQEEMCKMLKSMNDGR